MRQDPQIDGTVAALYYYPVKSLAGISLDRAVLTPRGIKHDRMWMLVKESGRFITQREEHRLALLRVEARGDAFRISDPSGAETHLPIRVPLDRSRIVRVWKDELVAAIGPSEACGFFSSYLGYPCLPVFMPEDAGRHAGRHAPPETPLSFADAYPGLILTEASITDLNERASIPLEVRRFRPNIVVSDASAYSEDGWSRILLGAAEIACVKPCSRCVLTTVDPDSGVSGKEPLRTLAQFRRQDNEVYFGQNFVVAREGTVSVGDRITVLERKAPLFPLRV